MTIKDYPYFGALRGRYKKEEIQECDEYARLYGVELIPCIQTLAHLRTALRWPKMMSYRDDKDILMVGEEETYKLIEAMLESVKEMYHSRKIHLGMDEAWYLGYGKYRLKYGPAGQGELIKRHLDRVMELCKKHGFEPMVWSDMFFVTAGCGDYYMAVSTATDPDHLDIYGTEEAYSESFAHFTSLIQPGGCLIMKKGIKLVPSVKENVKIYTYSARDSSCR